MTVERRPHVVLPSRAPARTKGIAFAHTRLFVEETFGAAGWERVLGRLLPADRAEVESVISVGWYDLGSYARLLRAIDEAHGTGDLSLVVQNGRFQSERDLSTIQRLFFRLANPAYAVEKITDYWRRFHDTGSWEVNRVSESEVTGALHDWGVVDRALCRELTGYMGRVLELVGAKHVIMEHTRCRALGDDVCGYRARWSAGKKAAIPAAPPPEARVAVSGTFSKPTPDTETGRSGVMSTLVSAGAGSSVAASSTPHAPTAGDRKR